MSCWKFNYYSLRNDKSFCGTARYFHQIARKVVNLVGNGNKSAVFLKFEIDLLDRVIWKKSLQEAVD